MTDLRLLRTLHGVWLIAIHLTNACVAGEPAEPRTFENEPGWEWIVAPIAKEPDPRPGVYIARHQPHQETPKENTWRGFIAIMEEGKNHELVLVFARQGSFPNYYGWRPIAFDVDGKRHDLHAHVAGGTGGIMLERWSSHAETLPASRVAFFGLEGKTLQAFMKESDAASQLAKERGIDVLPFPVVGKPYTFELKRLNGDVVTSNDLQGKVVLLDFWATWCFPCMAKMPELKELYADYHSRGFEILAVNLDHDQQACIEAVQRLNLPWDQAMAPTDEESRQLWENALGLRSLPRLLLIDRNGILHADCPPDQLESLMTGLLGEKHPR